MINIRFTKEELWAVMYAIESDIENIKHDPGYDDGDLERLEAVLQRLERADRESSEGSR